MTAPLVSVITPCYRQGVYLAAAIDSVLAQTHRAVEMIVVNDGSDDETDAVAGRYADRITYLCQENRGQSAARNAGLKRATGQYVLFLDADDLLHPKALAWLVEAARGEDNVLCVMGHRFFRQDPVPIEEEWTPPPVASILPDLIRLNLGPPHGYLSPRRLVEAVGGFDERLQGCEDWDLWLRLGGRGACLRVVPRIGAYYRRHDGSFSLRQSRMLTDRAEVLLRAHRRLLDDPQQLADCGGALLEAAYRVRRRCVAQKADPRYIAALSEAIGELARRGVGRRRSLSGRLLEAVLGGDRADRLALAYMRWRDPAAFAYYHESYW